jgi:replicative DNA helicase Mcm
VVSKGNGTYIEYTTVSEKLARQIMTSLLRFGIIAKVRKRPPAKKGFRGKHDKYEIIIRGRDNLEAFAEKINFTNEKAEKLAMFLSRKAEPNTNIDVIHGIGPALAEVRKSLGIRTKNDKELYLIRHYEHGRRDFSRQQLLKFAKALNRRKSHRYFDFLETLSQSDIFWDKVTAAGEVDEEWVYDLTVDGEHNFVANDFIVHNTATVVKDEKMGGWVLEAGAMVLSNKGMLAVDEFEKMEETDQVAMHEALEQGCYDYGTQLTMEDGSHVAIGDFVERHLNGAAGEDERKDISAEGIKVMSTDFKDVRPSKIKAVRRHMADETLLVRLSTGQEITITPNHPVFVMRKNRPEALEAKELAEGDWMPVPAIVPVAGRSRRFDFKPSVDGKTKGMTVPEATSPDFCEWLGLVAGEGNAEINRGRKAGIGFTNSERALVERYSSLLKGLFGIEPYVQARGSVRMVRAISSNLRSFAEGMGGSILGKSYEKSLPDWVFTLPENEIAALLRGLFNAEGSVNCIFGTVTFSTTSRKLAVQVQGLCQRLGIVSGLYDDRSMRGGRKRPAYKIQISSGRNVAKFSSAVGLLGRKAEALARLAAKKSVSSIWDHIPNIMGTVEEAKKTLRMSDKDSAGYILSSVRRRDSISRPLLAKMVSAFESRLDEISRMSGELGKAGSYAEYRKTRERLGISRSEIARSLGMTQQELWYWKAVKGDTGLLERSIAASESIAQRMLAARDTVARLRALADSPLEWASVRSISKVRKSQPVYDIEVNPTRTFIGNGIVCHNSVSIAKASIVATLPAQTSVLAGGNPKFSRFDEYRSIAEQINIPDTLLSRFDLKFVLKDRPNAERDRSIVDHVLKAREGDESGIEPEIENLLIKKYIAYSKKNHKPKLTKETGRLLRDFYLKTRKQAEGGGPVSITLRQFESMIRLSEASAKIQLSDVIRKSDAERAIRLMETSLKQLGYDTLTGRIDVDRAEGGTGFTERNMLRKLQDLINHMSQTKKEIPMKELRQAADKEGIPEHEVGVLVDRLKREGMLFEPNPGFVQKV